MTAITMSWAQLLSFGLSIVSIIFGWRLFSAVFQDQKHAKVWAKLDTVGLPSSGIFSWTRAIVASILQTRKNTHDGYNRICKAKDRPFALPTVWTGKAVVVLPPSLLHLLNMPDSEISGFNALLETVQLPYMISDRDIYENVLHFDVIRKKMAKKDFIGTLAGTTAEEIDTAFRKYWGTSEQWKTVNGWDACKSIITQTAMRIMVGLPLCRDEILLEQSTLYANAVFTGTGIINCFPPFTRPLIGPLLGLRAKYYQARCKKLLLPLVEERVRMWKERKEGDVLPNDFLQWLIPKCADEGPSHVEPDKIAMRLLASNTMFIFAIGFVFSSSVLDLYSSPPAARNEFLAGLEAECKDVSAKYHGLSTKEAVDSLYRVDSTIRESTRVSDFIINTLPLDVVSGQVDLGHGVKIPPGVRMVFPTQPMHLDPEYYDDPLCFDAFRFSRKFEGQQESQQQNRERELLITPTKSYLVFGYGRHSCPGRWFVSQTIKQALAHIILNYDVELVGQLRKRRSVLNLMVPPADAQIRIRRKSNDNGERS